MDLSVIIPVYNEEKNISLLYNEIKDALTPLEKSYEILFVNDGSTDNSLSELRKLSSTDTNLKTINLRKNFGQTPAIMAGFDNAQGNIIVTMDGDLQNDPNDIPELLKKLDEGFDLICGWRKKRKDNFLLRTLPSKIANFLISKVLKTNIHDYGCTLKVYKKDILTDMRLYGEMHRFIPAIANWRGAKIAEVETHHRPRKYGKTKYGLNRTIKVVLDLLLMAFLSEYSTKPLRFFGGIGLMSSGMGFLCLFCVVFMKIVSNVDMTGNPLLILSVLFFLVCIQLISLGFLGEINIRTYYESQDKKTYHISDIT